MDARRNWRNPMVKIKIYIEGGGKAKTWTAVDLFCKALEHQKPEELPLLLVDSEEAFKDDTSVWQHLKLRDNWDKPAEASEQHAYLMVQVMETWFLADIEALRAYFGNNLKPDKIPAWTDLESVRKKVVFETLDRATAQCGEKRYAKGKISFELLSSINPQKVADKCPHGKRLLDFLFQKR